MNQKSRDLRQQTAPTVCATIEQFNKVSLAVIATVLQATDSSNSHCIHQRGKTLTRWIEIAQVIKIWCKYIDPPSWDSSKEARAMYSLEGQIPFPFKCNPDAACIYVHVYGLWLLGMHEWIINSPSHSCHLWQGSIPAMQYICFISKILTPAYYNRAWNEDWTVLGYMSAQVVLKKMIRY